jgi:soluble lytic murein transglycosylase-like protein
MQPRIRFCNRCRGIKLGWNKRYISHRLICTKLPTSSTLGGSSVIALALLMLGFPKPGPSVFTAQTFQKPAQVARIHAKAAASVSTVEADVRSMNAFLKRHDVSEANRQRLAESIVASARKHDLNPRLLASIMIVESRGNPFAISGQDAIGIMQIHLPTWGQTADQEDINLFKIEDNIDFGARILKDYVSRYGVWEGVKRYNGYIPGDPAWEKSAQTYLEKVQRIYEIQQPAVPQAASTGKSHPSDSEQPVESL